MELKEYAAESIRDQADLTDLDVRIYEGYSGRFMYGKTCLGIVGSLNDCNAFIAECIAEAMITAGEDGRNKRELKRLLSHTSSDNMGLDMILYWPDIA